MPAISPGWRTSTPRCASRSRRSQLAGPSWPKRLRERRKRHYVRSYQWAARTQLIARHGPRDTDSAFADARPLIDSEVQLRTGHEPATRLARTYADETAGSAAAYGPGHAAPR